MSTEQAPPHIDYLARDFAGFRQLLLDHLSVTVPGWQERAAADQGNALIDLLAYAADYLAYYQDAVATEMYLGTARLRRSVRRHAQLLDYHLHEGCNARLWARVRVSADVALPRGTQLLTAAEGDRAPAVVAQGSADYADMLAKAPVVFETMHEASLFAEHNEIALDGQGELPAGTVAATLQGRLPNLAAGDVLIFAEVRGPSTGRPADASPARRHAVRISRIERAAATTTISWDEEDALPFALVTNRDFGAGARPISVAWGNIVLADHGRTIADEQLPPIPAAARYRPPLRLAGLTHAAPYEHARARVGQSAAATIEQECAAAMPAIELIELWPRPLSLQAGTPSLLTFKQFPAGSGGYFPTKPWALRRDLLSSGNLAREYIVEMEDDGTAYLRFGFADGGWQPSVVGASLLATYRIGGGPLGNVGRDSLASLALGPAALDSNTPPGGALPTIDEIIRRISDASNPLPARGGAAPQRIEVARMHAPHAFRSWQPPDDTGAEYDPRAYDAQSRCVTPADYASMAMRHPEVAEAVAEPRWTGSWTTLLVYVRRRDGWPEDAAFREELRAFLEPYRLVGYDLAVAPPCYVPLDVQLVAYLPPDRQQSVVRAALMQALFGAAGFFDPAGFGFGQPVHRSRLIACAAGVDGVARVRAGRFRRAGTASDAEHIAVGALEIARLSPARDGVGQFSLMIEGGIA